MKERVSSKQFASFTSCLGIEDERIKKEYEEKLAEEERQRLKEEYDVTISNIHKLTSLSPGRCSFMG